MKKFFFFILLFPIMAIAGLDETSLFSSDGTCQMHYLTTYPKDKWTIQLAQGECVDGVVQGFAKVDVSNFEKKLVERIQGFFIDGYWIGSFAAKGHMLKRTNPEENVQALSFVLDTDKDISYVVQLRSTQTQKGTYGPFMGCPDFRLMAVVSDENLFEKKSFQNKMAEHALSLAHRYCTHLDHVAVFGATKLQAESGDVLFQMDIDPETEEREIIFQKTVKTKKIVEPEQQVKLDKQDLKMTSVAHLDVLSRLTDKPVKGKTIVHVYQLNLDGTAFVDLPEKMTLKNNSRLRTGWSVVQGDYFQKEMSVFDIQPCLKEWCSDVQ